MKVLSVVILVLIGILVVTGLLYAETYTGKAENIEIATSKLEKGSNLETPMGIKFIVVIKDSKNNEVARLPDYIATGTITANQAIDAVKNEVDKKTMEFYAHIEGAKEVFTRKSEIEGYSKTIDKFVDYKDRPIPLTDRIE